MESEEPLEFLSDHELLVRSAANGVAFERFCERCLPTLYRYAVSVMRDLGNVPPDLASDFVHDAVLKVFRKVADGGVSAAPAFPRTYLRTTIFHLIVDWHRQHAISEFVAVMPQEAPSKPSRDLVEMIDEVSLVLNLLRPEEQEILEKILLSEISFDQLADEWGINPSAVEQRYYRALRRAREIAHLHCKGDSA